MGPRFRGDDAFAVIAGLDPAIHPSSQKLFAKKMDARVISAFARVFDALLPAHDAARAGRSDPCIFLFFCRFGIFHPRSHDLKHTHTHTSSFPRRMSAPGVCDFASLTPSEGWAERRETFGCCAKHPWGVPSCVKDARERAYDAGRSPLGAPPWRL